MAYSRYKLIYGVRIEDYENIISKLSYMWWDRDKAIDDIRCKDIVDINGIYFDIYLTSTKPIEIVVGVKICDIDNRYNNNFDPDIIIEKKKEYMEKIKLSECSVYKAFTNPCVQIVEN